MLLFLLIYMQYKWNALIYLVQIFFFNYKETINKSSIMKNFLYYFRCLNYRCQKGLKNSRHNILDQKFIFDVYNYDLHSWKYESAWHLRELKFLNFEIKLYDCMKILRREETASGRWWWIYLDSIPEIPGAWEGEGRGYGSYIFFIKLFQSYYF